MPETAMAVPLSFTSRDVNTLIYRYLVESGMKHSSFVFRSEARMESNDRATTVDSGRLVKLLALGLRWLDAEAHINDMGVHRICNASVSLLDKHKCDLARTPYTNSDASLAGSIFKKPEPRVRQSSATLREKDNYTGALTTKQVSWSRNNSVSNIQAMTDDHIRKRQRNDNDVESNENEMLIDRRQRDVNRKSNRSSTDTWKDAQLNPNLSEDLIKQDVILQVSLSNVPSSGHISVTSSSLTLLEGHTKPPYICHWTTPKDQFLITGATDSVRIWTLTDTVASNQYAEPIVLQPSADDSITAVAVDTASKVVALGTYSGTTWIYSLSGTLNQTIREESSPMPAVSPVFALKFSPSGRHLGIGGVQKNVTVVAMKTGELHARWEGHTGKLTGGVVGVVFDLDWMDDDTIASGSADSSVRLWTLGQTTHYSILQAHTAEVNTVRWSPRRVYLASASDDCTIRLWRRGQDHPHKTLQGLTAAVDKFEWCPVEVGGATLIAGASKDHNIRIWDADTGIQLFNIQRKTGPVHCLSFSLDGQFLSTGGEDQYIHIYKLSDCATGKIERTFYACGWIIDVRYNSTGNRLAVCLGNNKVAVLSLPSPSSSS